MDNYFTIAFYNLENLFDIFDNKYTHDDDFLPTSEKKWTPKRYKKKVRKLGYTISKIGVKTSKKLPILIGLAEVENKLVVNDLINSKFLKTENYDVVHFDSADERGIDVALMYHKDFFEVIKSETFTVKLYDENEEIDYTRDILLVEGFLNKEKIYVLVNHWPSRREGKKTSEPKRIIASDKVTEIIDLIKQRDENPKIIVMGDFNDNPNNESIKRLVISQDLYNPMETLLSDSRGTLNYKFKWNLFDQILFSTNFFKHKANTHRFSKANVFDNEFLKQFKGKYKGTPFRTYVGKKYKGGYSDHFPVYIHLNLNSM
ncbi:endonuclease [Flavobacteriaceae bacterium AH-315-B10]|nr:endonuclease [Flavobacteriaceae bacterium AH-315-B10]